MKIGKNKLENVSHAINCIRKTVEKDRPKLVALPECFNSPYGTKYFNEYAETIPDGHTSQALSSIAKELNVVLVGGTIPERDTSDNKLYNTCTVWSPTGDLITKYRKVCALGCRFCKFFHFISFQTLMFVTIDQHRSTCLTSMWKAVYASKNPKLFRQEINYQFSILEASKSG